MNRVRSIIVCINAQHFSFIHTISTKWIFCAHMSSSCWLMYKLVINTRARQCTPTSVVVHVFHIYSISHLCVRAACIRTYPWVRTQTWIGVTVISTPPLSLIILPLALSRTFVKSYQKMIFFCVHRNLFCECNDPSGNTSTGWVK
jgi:hypothetical protein